MFRCSGVPLWRQHTQWVCCLWTRCCFPIRSPLYPVGVCSLLITCVFHREDVNSRRVYLALKFYFTFLALVISYLLMKCDACMCVTTSHHSKEVTGLFFSLMREAQNGYCCCTPDKWCFYLSHAGDISWQRTCLLGLDSPLLNVSACFISLLRMMPPSCFFCYFFLYLFTPIFHASIKFNNETLFLYELALFASWWLLSLYFHLLCTLTYSFWLDFAFLFAYTTACWRSRQCRSCHPFCCVPMISMAMRWYVFFYPPFCAFHIIFIFFYIYSFILFYPFCFHFHLLLLRCASNLALEWDYFFSIYFKLWYLNSVFLFLCFAVRIEAETRVASHCKWTPLPECDRAPRCWLTW